MNDPHQATHLLTAATDGLTPDVDRIVSGAVGRGRTLRRRRRLGTTLAAVAVLGVTGPAASLAFGHGGGSAPGRDAAAIASEPAATPLASTLASMLPPGKATALADEGGPGYHRGGLLYKGTRVFVYVYRADSCDTAPLLTDVGCYDLAPRMTRPRSGATTETSADGHPKRRHAEADLTRPDGWRVSVVATNDRETDGPVVRRFPPLSRAQLLRIARADVWLEEPQ